MFGFCSAGFLSARNGAGRKFCILQLFYEKSSGQGSERKIWAGVKYWAKNTFHARVKFGEPVEKYVVIYDSTGVARV